MLVKEIQDENLQDYKKISMFVCSSACDWKCCTEAGNDICQNMSSANMINICIPNECICQRYLNNPLSKAIIFGGLEPILQINDVFDIIRLLRCEYECFDDIVIYTGYEKYEISEIVKKLSNYRNIIVKFGRYMPDRDNVYSPELGIYLASDNQYALKLS